MHSTYNNPLLVDVGGTNTRLAFVDNNIIKRIDYFPTNKETLVEKLDNHSRNFDGLSISVAGPVIDDAAKITFNSFSIKKSELEKNFDKVFMINDYEAAAYGLIGLDKMHYKIIVGKPDDSKLQMIFGIGTAIGVGIRIGQNASGTEFGFLPYFSEKRKEKSYLEWREKNGMLNDMHSVVAKDSIYDLVEYKGNVADRLDSRIYGYFFVEDSYNAKQMWIDMLAKTIQQAALIFKPQGGIFLTGGTLHRYHRNIDWIDLRSKMMDHDTMSEMLGKIPLLLLDNEKVLEGCHYAYMKHFIQD